MEHNRGALYATTKEMRTIRGERKRLAVYLADLDYVSERRMRALEMYQRIDRGEVGRLTKNEKAYVTYAIFACMCWNPKMDEIAFIEPRLDLFRGTASEPRALFGCANRISGGASLASSVPKKLKAYELLRQRCPSSQEAKDSLFLSAWNCKLLIEQFVRVTTHLAENGPDDMNKATIAELKNVEPKLPEILEYANDAYHRYLKKQPKGSYGNLAREGLDYLDQVKMP